MGAVAQLRNAQTALREERERTIAERDTFACFLHRVDTSRPTIYGHRRHRHPILRSVREYCNR